MTFEVGQIVEHKALPELGRARVDLIANERLFVTFERKNGGEQKTFVIPNENITLSTDQAPAGFEAPKVVKAAKGKARLPKAKAPARSFDEAWAAFIAQYPRGFEDPAYAKDERENKLQAQARWRDRFSSEKVAALRHAGDTLAVAQAFSDVYKGCTLLHTLEWIKFFNVLKTSAKAIDFLDANLSVIAEGSLSEDGFERLKKAYGDQGLDLKWTVLTLWPFIASDKGFVFLKPLATQAAAHGLGLPLNYSAAPGYPTYKSCQELYQALEAKLQPLGAKDAFDVQSFIWVGWKD
jgi:hypothetical protein